MLWCCWLGGRKGIRPVKKTERWDAGMVICLEWGADLHMAQLMPLPLTVSCFSKIQIGFTFLVPAHLCIPGKRAIKRVCSLWCLRVQFLAFSVLTRLGSGKGIRPVKNLSSEVLTWLSVSSEVQTCVWPMWYHCHSLSLAPVKSRLVLPFWYRLTWICLLYTSPSPRD